LEGAGGGDYCGFNGPWAPQKTKKTKKARRPKMGVQKKTGGMGYKRENVVVTFGRRDDAETEKRGREKTGYHYTTPRGESEGKKRGEMLESGLPPAGAKSPKGVTKKTNKTKGGG